MQGNKKETFRAEHGQGEGAQQNERHGGIRRHEVAGWRLARAVREELRCLILFPFFARMPVSHKRRVPDVKTRYENAHRTGSYGLRGEVVGSEGRRWLAHIIKVQELVAE